jgi:hypothetical protein
MTSFTLSAKSELKTNPKGITTVDKNMSVCAYIESLTMAEQGIFILLASRTADSASPRQIKEQTSQLESIYRYLCFHKGLHMEISTAEKRGSVVLCLAEERGGGVVQKISSFNEKMRN